MLHIDVRILGEEYKNKTFTGRAICAKRGIELFFNKRVKFKGAVIPEIE